MNKSELIEVLGAKLSVTRTEAERFLNGLIEMIYGQLAKGEKVTIYGFGQFSSAYRGPRAGINPRKFSQRLVVPERNAPKFVAGDGFKQAVKIISPPNPLL